ncbi:hypothetical protein J6590_073594 [Homalodisca vitripennis]|nr:hypothetical protein J6590_073594 [Homalodisca vitripennis]
MRSREGFQCLDRGDPVDYFLHEQPVYCLSIDPFNDNVFASACEDGRILIYDIREPTSSDPFALAVCSSAFHGVMFNPCESQLVATANAKDGAALWDVRKPKEVLVRYGSAESCMSVRWDGRGHRLLALRRRMPPILYPVDSPFHLAQFDHSSYYNSCTMKSCSFAGENDQYVLSGSDDFNLYMWKIPESGPGTWVPSAHMILTGHRSIVNQVRFNSTNHLIASSGVEKMIKVWSPFPLPNSNGDDTHHRRVFSHEEYIGLVLSSGQYLVSTIFSLYATESSTTVALPSSAGRILTVSSFPRIDMAFFYSIVKLGFVGGIFLSKRLA